MHALLSFACEQCMLMVLTLVGSQLEGFTSRYWWEYCTVLVPGLVLMSEPYHKVPTGDMGVLQLLLVNGATSLHNKLGQTPLHVATARNKVRN